MFPFYINCTYRCGFFYGEIDKPVQGLLQRAKRKAVSVGICLEGVYVMDVKEKVSTGSSVIDSFVKHQHSNMFLTSMQKGSYQVVKFGLVSSHRTGISLTYSDLLSKSNLSNSNDNE